ncbi:Hypothetical_protein [Hexamita inflata]|uniref:Hypothetical_protein n=1 Tax=Hexamita inflata TaxID=28002 RepID=A0AA86UEQ0_9EUKA|nr:Hypothetical protein HINF_LOCUS35837 [Hexamita inflata]
MTISLSSKIHQKHKTTKQTPTQHKLRYKHKPKTNRPRMPQITIRLGRPTLSTPIVLSQRLFTLTMSRNCINKRELQPSMKNQIQPERIKGDRVRYLNQLYTVTYCSANNVIIQYNNVKIIITGLSTSKQLSTLRQMSTPKQLSTLGQMSTPKQLSTLGQMSTLTNQNIVINQNMK